MWEWRRGISAAAMKAETRGWSCVLWAGQLRPKLVVGGHGSIGELARIEAAHCQGEGEGVVSVQVCRDHRIHISDDHSQAKHSRHRVQAGAGQKRGPDKRAGTPYAVPGQGVSRSCVNQSVSQSVSQSVTNHGWLTVWQPSMVTCVLFQGICISRQYSWAGMSECSRGDGGTNGAESAGPLSLGARASVHSLVLNPGRPAGGRLQAS